jgi:2'-5' RNA ligase
MSEAIMIPAGPRVDDFRPHLTAAFVHHDDLVPGVNRAIEQFVNQNVPVDDEGFRTLPSWPREPWGDNSWEVLGELKEFKQALDEYLVTVFGSGAFGDLRRAHINVNGDWDQPLYDRIRMMDRM